MRRVHEVGVARPVDLADALGVSKGTVSKILYRLIDKSLIIMSVDSADHRCKSLALTAAGVEQVRKLNALANVTGEEVFSSLNEEERNQLEQLLVKTIKRFGCTFDSLNGIE